MRRSTGSGMPSSNPCSRSIPFCSVRRPARRRRRGRSSPSLGGTASALLTEMAFDSNFTFEGFASLKLTSSSTARSLGVVTRSADSVARLTRMFSMRPCNEPESWEGS
ncbi:hypothetical protein ACFPRL_22950 [Pseudoclavibacter helvolus]